MKLRRMVWWYRHIMWVKADGFGRFVLLYVWGFMMYAAMCIGYGVKPLWQAAMLEYALIAVYSVRLVIATVRERRAYQHLRDEEMERLTNIAAHRPRRQWTEDEL